MAAYMKRWMVWVGLMFGFGCAGADRTAAPPTSPRECAGAVVRSAAELSALEGCTHVRGDLVIEAPDLVDLAPLASVWSIDGTLSIQGCSRLESLHGLERLNDAGFVAIVNSPALERLSNLRSLRHTRGVTVIGSPRLRDLRGLEQLEQLEGLVLVDTGLFNLRGLEELRAAGDVVIADNRRLVDAAALSNLRWAEHLTLERNPALAPSLGFFDGLEHVGAVELSDNGWITELEEQTLRERRDPERRSSVFSGPAKW